MTKPVTSMTLTPCSVTQKWRPAIHFSPQKNWINDPNGLVYFEGEYHLFYQYNPHGKSWGHMSWGHAVSADLLHWKELGVAIPEREFMAFSGCALVDWNNTSGLGDGQKPPLLAYYTAYHAEEKRQTQRLAFSHDRGRSWIEYKGNPILDLDMEHFRDPSVFWHNESQAWVMVVALPGEHKLQIYNSKDLKNWQLESEIGPLGNTNGQWECPALFNVKIENENTYAWVLKIDVDVDIIGCGSGAQYFMGNFDGKVFSPECPAGEIVPLIADFGGDFYAAIPWNDLPEEDTDPIWIGWFSNHQTGKDFPTNPWRGSMTLPRELFGFREDGVLKLGQRPIENLSTLRSVPMKMDEQIVTPGGRIALPIVSIEAAFEVNFELEPLGPAVAGVRLRDYEDREILIGYDVTAKEVFVDRSKSFSAFNSNFAAKHSAPVSDAGLKHLQIIYDKSSVEVFVDGGRRVISEKIFPQGLKAVELFSEIASTKFRAIRSYHLTL